MPTAFKKQLKAKHVKEFFHYGYAYWLRFSQTPSPPAFTATAQNLREHQVFLPWNKCESLVSLWWITVVLKHLLAMTQILKIKDKTPPPCYAKHAKSLLFLVFKFKKNLSHHKNPNTINYACFQHCLSEELKWWKKHHVIKNCKKTLMLKST